jgi:hypothetical protein
MVLVNDMRRKILGALKSQVQDCGLDWVEIRDFEGGGCVWFQPVGEFRTVLRLEYEFESRSCRLLLFRNGRHVAGRCGIQYDDGTAIEAVVEQFGGLLNERLLGFDSRATLLDYGGTRAARWTGSD